MRNRASVVKKQKESLKDWTTRKEEEEERFEICKDIERKGGRKYGKEKKRRLAEKK